jgi:hypothetical protein
MTIDPANPNIMHESYFTSLEPHHFRFVEQDGEARLNLHDDRAGEYKGVHILVEYAKGLEMYESGGDSKCESEFFSLRFFKKGTLHLTFKDEQLWQRFNQFVARERGWLPGETKSKRA